MFNTPKKMVSGNNLTVRKQSDPCFKLVELAKLYSAKLRITYSSEINTTRLNERLLGVFPDLSAHTQGRDVLLIFNHAIGDAIRKACEQDFDSEALHLARAAKIVRRDLFKMTSICVSESLKALVDLILEGPRIKKTAVEENPSKMACLTIAQLLALNSTKYALNGDFTSLFSSQ